MGLMSRCCLRLLEFADTLLGPAGGAGLLDEGDLTLARHGMDVPQVLSPAPSAGPGSIVPERGVTVSALGHRFAPPVPQPHHTPPAYTQPSSLHVCQR